jgi:hypothetical protein
MQYKNITLALVLLATTAIVSASSSEEALEAKIFAKIDSGKLTNESLAEFSLSSEIVQALVEADNLSADDIKTIIESKADPAAVVDNAEGAADKVAEGAGANITAEGTAEGTAGEGTAGGAAAEGTAAEGTAEGAAVNTTAEGAAVNTTAEGAAANTAAEGAAANTTAEGAAANTTAEGAAANTAAANTTAEGTAVNEVVAKGEGSNNEVTSNTSTLSETSIKPWYTSTLFMVACGVVGLSALGGGIYMMTNKSSNTDL